MECLGEGIPRGPTETGTTTMTFSNLPHHTMYACRVAAVNVNGTGPYSMYKNITTPQGGELVVSAGFSICLHSLIYFHVRCTVM